MTNATEYLKEVLENPYRAIPANIHDANLKSHYYYEILNAEISNNEIIVTANLISCFQLGNEIAITYIENRTDPLIPTTVSISKEKFYQKKEEFLLFIKNFNENF